MYSSRHGWLEHERLVHRRVWQCFEHVDAIYPSPTELQNHLQAEHGDRITQSQIQDLLAVSESSMMDKRSYCPICLFTGPFEKGLGNHIAFHLESFAVFALSSGDFRGEDIVFAEVDDSYKAQNLQSISEGTSMSLGSFDSRPRSATSSEAARATSVEPSKREEIAQDTVEDSSAQISTQPTGMAHVMPVVSLMEQMMHKTKRLIDNVRNTRYGAEGTGEFAAEATNMNNLFRIFRDRLLDNDAPDFSLALLESITSVIERLELLVEDFARSIHTFGKLGGSLYWLLKKAQIKDLTHQFQRLLTNVELYFDGATMKASGRTRHDLEERMIKSTRELESDLHDMIESILKPESKTSIHGSDGDAQAWMPERTLQRFSYPGMNDRRNDIVRNHPETFRWIFGVKAFSLFLTGGEDEPSKDTSPPSEVHLHPAENFISGPNRPMTSSEAWALYKFEEHTQRCTACSPSFDVLENGTMLCVNGYACVRSITSLLYKKGGFIFGVRKVDGQDVKVEVPSGFKHSLKLFEAIDRTQRHQKRGLNFFWIEGKPGSGKSTLMKFLCQDQETLEMLKRWQPCVVILSYFFWHAGNFMQKSLMGLLRSLMYQLLSTEPSTIEDFMKIFPEMEKNSIHHWRISSLRNAFIGLVKMSLRPICIFLDGLDECEGDQRQLISLIGTLLELRHIKICVSSRPRIMLSTLLDTTPQLKLQEMTALDIETFTKARLLEAAQKKSAYEKQILSELADVVTLRAEGVFLWADLTTNTLLRGFRNGDSVHDLKRRIMELQLDLASLFEQAYLSLQPSDRMTAVEHLHFITQSRLHAKSVLAFLIAFNPVLQHEVVDLGQKPTSTTLVQECRSFERRIVASSAGLLEIRDQGEVRVDEDRTVDFYDKFRIVHLMHPSVQDFIQMEANQDALGFYRPDRQKFIYADIRVRLVRLAVLSQRPLTIRQIRAELDFVHFIDECEEGLASSTITDLVSVVGKFFQRALAEDGLIIPKDDLDFSLATLQDFEAGPDMFLGLVKDCGLMTGLK